MKTFKDLAFKPFKFNSYKEKQARMEFANGYEVSVLFGRGYSNGVNNYELAVLVDGELCYDTPLTDDVLAYITRSEVTEAMAIIQELPPVTDDIKERIKARNNSIEDALEDISRSWM